jgi:hypothetical protein
MKRWRKLFTPESYDGRKETTSPSSIGSTTILHPDESKLAASCGGEQKDI